MTLSDKSYYFNDDQQKTIGVVLAELLSVFSPDAIEDALLALDRQVKNEIIISQRNALQQASKKEEIEKLAKRFNWQSHRNTHA